MACIHTGKPRRAAEVLEGALRRHPDRKDNDLLCRNLGIAYTKLGDVRRAERSFQKAVALNPRYGDGYESLGNLAFANADYKASATYYGKAAALAPEDAGLRRKAGLAWYFAENYAASIEAFQHAIALDSTDAEPYRYLSQAYRAQGETVRSVEAAKLYLRHAARD